LGAPPANPWSPAAPHRAGAPKYQPAHRRQARDHGPPGHQEEEQAKQLKKLNFISTINSEIRILDLIE